MSDQRPENPTQMVVLGALVMAAGALVTLLCGACTVYFGAMSLAVPSGQNAGDGLMLLAVPLIIGGIPTVSGIVVFGLGAWMFRRGLKRRE